MSTTHEFALYDFELSTRTLKKGELLSLANKDLFHRIAHVLRLKVGEQLKLFDRYQNIEINIDAISKKDIKAIILASARNIQLDPHITFYLPLLKRDALENAIYSCVEVGANEVQLIQTQKVHRAWKGRELQRLEKIAIAAAEQSKNFAFPEIKAPISLTEAISSNSANLSVFFDPEGASAVDIIKKAKKGQKMALMVGPEADLAQVEKMAIQAENWQFCPLTPTVLQAQTAVPIGLGLFRTLIG